MGGMKPPPATGLVGEDTPTLWGGRGGSTCFLNQRSLALEGADTHGLVVSLGGWRGPHGCPLRTGGHIPEQSTAAPRKRVPSPRPTWSPQSQTMLYIIWATQKQCRKLWKGFCR